MRRRGILAIALTVFALTAPASAQWGAGPGPGPGPGPSGVPPASAQWGGPGPPGGVQTLDQILPGVRTGHPGRFYDAEGPFPDGNGSWHYRLKWLTPQGRVIWLDTDARTGRVIGPWARGPGVFGPVPPGPPPFQRRFTPGGWGRGFGRGWPGRGRWPGR